MNETNTYTDELHNLLVESIETAGESKKFLEAEIPEVINQLLMWEAIKSGLSLVAGVFSLMIAIKSIRKVIVQGVEVDSLLEETQLTMSLITTVVSISCSLAFLANGFDWLQILIAPKYYLLEMASELLKQTA